MLRKCSNESTGVGGSPKQQSAAQLMRRKHRTYWNTLPSSAEADSGGRRDATWSELLPLPLKPVLFKFRGGKRCR